MGIRSIFLESMGGQLARVAICVGCLTVAASNAATAEDQGWQEMSFPYSVVDQDVRDALAELGRNLQVGVDVSEAVEGRVRGPWRTATVGDFLNRLASDLDVEWFFDGRRLSVSAASESMRRMLSLQGVEPKAWQVSLERLGLANDQFPIVIDADREMALVSGPPQYVELVMQSLPKRVETSGRVNVIYGRGNRGDES